MGYTSESGSVWFPPEGSAVITHFGKVPSKTTVLVEANATFTSYLCEIRFGCIGGLLPVEGLLYVGAIDIGVPLCKDGADPVGVQYALLASWQGLLPIFSSGWSLSFVNESSQEADYYMAGYTGAKFGNVPFPWGSP